MSSTELFAIEPEPGAASAGSPATHRGESQSLYRKYRPQSFAEDELVGQEHIVQTLRNAIVLGRVVHAYLFCGPRGTGKTTTARLLAKAVNCLDPNPNNRPCNVCAACVAINTGATTDVIEIDAASNRGIDDIRDLRERVKYAPTQLATKFYIIDEAHQITGAAANAFLKTLEEPPGHTRFVLATTDPEELLQTIVSRCQRFDFRRISLDAMVRRLQTVVNSEGLRADVPALEAIARYATGSLRDALGLLDQLSVYQEERGETGERLITVDAVRALLGISRNERITGLVNAVAERDPGVALELVNEAIDAGEDARQLNRQLVAFLRELMFTRAGADRTGDETARAISARFSIYELSELARLFSEVDFKIKRSVYGQLPLEIALIEAIERGSAPERSERRSAPSPVAQATARPEASTPPPRQPEAQSATSLTDRIRKPSAAGRADRNQPKLDAPLSVAPAPGIARKPETVIETQKQSATSEEPLRSLGSATGEPAGPLTVENLANQWMQIRLDVKSVDRRIEALLASSDPHDVVKQDVHIVSPYEFHARKLNEDGPRNLIADVMGRIFGQRVVVYAHQIDQAPPRSSANVEPAAPQPEPPAVSATVEASDDVEASEAPAPVDAGAILEERTKTAMSIFDAVPIDDPGGKRPD